MEHGRSTRLEEIWGATLDVAEIRVQQCRWNVLNMELQYCALLAHAQKEESLVMS